MTKQSGLALIVTLIYLQIITILGMYAVECAIQAEKMSRLNGQQNEIFINAEQVLHFVEIQLTKEIPSCLISITQPSELMSKPLEWWQSPDHCAGVFQLFQYYYVIEKLGVDVCVNEIATNARATDEIAVNGIFASRNTEGEYIRITLLTIDKKNESREMLQSTIITLNHPFQPCDSDRSVILGRQMWRELR